MKFCPSQGVFIGKSNLYQERYSLAPLSCQGRTYDIWYAHYNLLDSWQHHLRNYTVILVFSRNQVPKVCPLVCNHRLSDEKWIQLSADGAEIISVKNPRTSERSIACSHDCLIWVCRLLNLGRKIFLAYTKLWLPAYIYLFFFRFTVGNNISLHILKEEYIAKDLRCPALRLLEKNKCLVPEDRWGPFKIFVDNWTSENTPLTFMNIPPINHCCKRCLC